MNKEKILQITTSHRQFFQFGLSLYNHLNLKNRLHSKGCKLSTGITLIRGLKIICTGSNNEIVLGDYARIHNCTFIIQGSNNRISILDYAYLNQVEICMEDSNNEISIGEHTILAGNTHLATIEGTKITIGSRCLLSGDLHFRTGDSHSVVDLSGKRINPSQDITISDHVWVGTRVTCLKGVYVAENSIVGATTTLCTRYEAPNCVIAGVPGKIVKTGVNWDINRLPTEEP